MDDETRANAIAKLEAMHFEVGYPLSWPELQRWRPLHLNGQSHSPPPPELSALPLQVWACICRHVRAHMHTRVYTHAHTRVHTEADGCAHMEREMEREE
eukprot:1991100-Rhodomonas_salina.1